MSKRIFSVFLGHLNRALATLTIGCAAINLAHAQTAPKYKIKILSEPPEPNTFSIGTAISSTGSVAGISYWDRRGYAIKWRNVTATVLDPDPLEESFAHSISRDGTVVGSDGPRPVIWVGRRMTVLPRFSTEERGGVACGINDRGEIVGQDYGLAAIWKDGVIAKLPGIPNKNYSEALAINNNGEIIGYMWYNKLQPFYWKPGGAVVELEQENSCEPYNVPVGLNDAGYIVGTAGRGKNCDQGPALWNSSGEISYIAPSDNRIGMEVATDISEDSTLIVGYSADYDSLANYRCNSAALTLSQSSGAEAKLWMKNVDGGWADLNLNDLVVNRGNWRLLAATSISDTGLITGIASDGISRTTAYRLTPIVDE